MTKKKETQTKTTNKQEILWWVDRNLLYIFIKITIMRDVSIFLQKSCKVTCTIFLLKR